jgi:hypothetical protein
LKNVLVEDEEDIAADSSRTKALKFLNALETLLHGKLLQNRSISPSAFQQLFSAREFIRQPGSSAKNLLESLALVIPEFTL